MIEPTGLWVYCVIHNRGILNLETQGIHGTSPVHTVAHGDFAMVVSAEPMKKYRLARDFLIAHQLVNEKVMQTQPVLPVKFCTMAKNAEQIVEQVLKQKEKTEEFRKTFAEIDGKNEYGLRARWKNMDQVFADLTQENEKVKTAKERALRLSNSERHVALIDIGHVVKEALEEKNARTAELLIRELAPHAVQYKRQNVLGDMNILNTAFLVDAERQVRFDLAVNTLVERYESLMQFKYVGPAPPFNFVEIVIHWDGTGNTTG
ncbi:MAG: GvpL/GvpF family gas vesicle protein [Candidatus Eisenbacteria bacterium]|nr:GvpL/GvpF family gas vesicle protein [Candidatus Eisenbacteria bacterium]